MRNYNLNLIINQVCIYQLRFVLFRLPLSRCFSVLAMSSSLSSSSSLLMVHLISICRSNNRHQSMHWSDGLTVGQNKSVTQKWSVPVVFLSLLATLTLECFSRGNKEKKVDVNFFQLIIFYMISFLFLVHFHFHLIWAIWTKEKQFTFLGTWAERTNKVQDI